VKNTKLYAVIALTASRWNGLLLKHDLNCPALFLAEQPVLAPVGPELRVQPINWMASALFLVPYILPWADVGKIKTSGWNTCPAHAVLPRSNPAPKTTAATILVTLAFMIQFSSC
jgi:hypothetical protein